MSKKKSVEEKYKTSTALRSNTYIIFAVLLLLVGVTWAWFTSVSTVEVEDIQSGTLEVTLVDKDGNSLDGQILEFETEGEDEILWEPGATYNLQEVYVKNIGTLPLKYNLKINGIEGSAKLIEVIDWTVDGISIDETYVLQPGETSEKMVLRGHMDEKAENEYQDLSIEGVKIEAKATQVNNPEE